MGKNKAIITILVLGMLIISGCSGETVSDDIITISQYRGLEVTLPAEQTEEHIEEHIWEALLKNCNVEEYPEAELNQLFGEIRLEYSYAIPEGKDVSAYIEEIHGMSVEELAKRELTKQYAVRLIAEKEELTLTDEQYVQEVQEQAKIYGISETDYENMLGRDYLRHKFLEERVMEFLKENLQ